MMLKYFNYNENINEIILKKKPKMLIRRKVIPFVKFS